MVAVQKAEYEVGFDIHYLCRKNYLLDGPQKITCLSNGSWSASPPHCRGEQQLKWAFQENQAAIFELVIKKKKRKNLVSAFLFLMPSARCVIPAERSRVVIGGIKRWPFDITDAMVPHGENVTFFCKHPRKHCSFTAAQTCFDGKLQTPACYLGKPQHALYASYQCFLLYSCLANA